MSDPIISPPTLDGFVAWAQWAMGVPTTAMSPTDPGWNFAFTISQDLVPLDFLQVNPDIYTLTVYNYGGSLLLNWQQDYPGQTYWADARKQFGTSSFTAGVIETANDVTTGESIAIGLGLKNLTLMDLQRLKDPYGRTATGFMQAIGTLWGLT